MKKMIVVALASMTLASCSHLEANRKIASFDIGVVG